LIAYSTAPGSVASDGRGANSPYTQALAAAIRAPGVDVFRTFNNVAVTVEDATDGQQQPWTSASAIKGDFYFAGGPSTAPPAAMPAPVAAAPSAKALELAFWQSIENSADPAEYQAYLRKYPGGDFAQLAQERIGDARDAAEEIQQDVPQQMGAHPTPARPVDDRLLLQREMGRGYLGLRFVNAEQKRTLSVSAPVRPNTPTRALRLRLIEAAMIPGALVRRVDVPSPAATAGLSPGDVITAVDGAPVATPAQFNAQLRAREAGAAVNLSVARGRQRGTLRITLTQTPAYQAAFVLGNMYAAGRNLPQSDVEAYRWFDIAVAKFPPSDPELRSMAVKRRNAMAARMSTIQVAEAQRLERAGP
jgi:hypothetical protein